MGFFNFHKQPKPSGFHYRPRFFNESSCDGQQTSGLYEQEAESLKTRIHFGFASGRRGFEGRNYNSQAMAKQYTTQIAVVIMISLLIAIFYFLA